jgi:hypothetical protein
MTHLVAILFFSGLMVGLALILQFTLRAHGPDMIAALLGRPMRRQLVRPAATVSVPRSRPRQRAAVA